MNSADFRSMMALEPHGPDTFVATGPRYPWGGLYGGQIIAQALRAASLTVDPAYRLHSLHAYFIRLGDAAEPIRLEVDRIRNGLYPAIMLEMTEEDPRENTTPRKSETPLKAADSDPGM